MSKLKVTVCELRNTSETLVQDWQSLAEHTQANHSELVLLPEMPFSPWLAYQPEFEAKQWQRAIEQHDEWITRLHELSAQVVAGTRPVVRDGKRLNEGFIWNKDSGYQAVHQKHYLPDEDGFWEATWFQRGDDDFNAGQVEDLRGGFLICTEVWFSQHAREYSKQGIHLLFCPRATPDTTTEKWLAGGQSAAAISGAYCLSSNFSGTGPGWQWGGAGWIAEPDQGSLLGVTSPDAPFLTLEIDLAQAEKAKYSFPRNVPD